MAAPSEPSPSPLETETKPGRSIWRVTAWLWKQEDTDADGGTGTEIESFELPDRDLAIAAAHMLVDRYVPLASAVAEIDVSLSGPHEAGEGGLVPVASFKYGRDTAQGGTSCLSH